MVNALYKQRNCVYEIRNLKNDKYYIGSSVNPRRRFSTHKAQLRKGQHPNILLQNAWDRYDDKYFVFKVLEEYPTKEAMLDAEHSLLQQHAGEKYTYNLKLGATAGPYHSPETIQKISKAVRKADKEGKGKRHHIVTKETRQRMSEALTGNTCATGVKRTPEQRKAISDRMKGQKLWQDKHHSEESKIKMGKPTIAVSPTGEETRYNKIDDCRKDLDMAGLSNLIRACKTGKALSNGPHSGWSFYYEGSDNRIVIPEEYKDYPRTRSEAIEQNVKYYFTGLPCKRGHVGLRLKKGTCKQCL